MELVEALNISGVPLSEATLTQIMKRINKHKGMVDSGEELARHLAADNAFKQSLSTVDNATEQEQSQYASFIKDPMVSKAIESLPAVMQSSFRRFADLSSEAEPSEEPATAKAREKGPLANMPEKDKNIINQMQKDFIKAKTPQQKSDMIKKWTSNTYNAKLYKLALKTGII